MACLTKQLSSSIYQLLRVCSTDTLKSTQILSSNTTTPFVKQGILLTRSLSTRFGVKKVTGNEMAQQSQKSEVAKDNVVTGGGGPVKNNFVVCIEGNIGCGKTTLLDYFKNTAGCEVMAEPVDKWRNIKGHNALELMYQDPVRWGMTLQTYIQLTMLQMHTKPQVDPVRLMERSIYSAKYCFTDNLFKSGKMKEIDHVILTEWFEWIMKTQNVKVDLIVYVRTDPDVLYSRIKERCRQEEEAIPLEYLRTLHNLHEDWLIHKKIPCPAEVLVIDGNPSREDMIKIYESHRGKILLQN